MKTINIPAQVTTVEDRIVGGLTLTQLALLIAPIFVDFVFYVVIPKSLHVSIFKAFLMACVFFIFFVSAIRFKEKIILFWIITLARFKFRPKIYVFSKKSTYLRDEYSYKEYKEIPQKINATTNQMRTVSTDKAELPKGLTKLDLNFIEQKKGRLYVYVNQSK